MLTAMTNAEHVGGQQPSAAAVVGGHGTATGNNVDRDYIMMDDLLQDMADDEGGRGGDGDGESADVMELEDAEPFEGLANSLDHNNILFRSPRWLENFREMKQAAIDPLYKDGGKCTKHWMALHFNL